MEALLLQMRSQGARPDTYTLNALLRACGARGRPYRALAHLRILTKGRAQVLATPELTLTLANPNPNPNPNPNRNPNPNPRAGVPCGRGERDAALALPRPAGARHARAQGGAPRRPRG